MKLTKNFSKSEFECKCGCEMPQDVLDNIKIVAEQLQIVRNKLNKPIKINSAYRCPKHNEIIGGSHKIVNGKRIETSQHVLGKASDIVINGMSPNGVFGFMNKLMALDMIKLGGLGQYNTFTHFDIRGYIARWDNRS
jgi:uncharacterized protein YcbK (DUF882 family)